MSNQLRIFLFVCAVLCSQFAAGQGQNFPGGTGVGTVNPGTACAGCTAGYPSTSAAVSPYPVHGIITNNLTGIDWCIRAQTAQGVTFGGVGAVAIDATAEIANAVSGQLSCSDNPFLVNQVADIFYIPNGITQAQYPFQVRSSSIFVQGGGRGGYSLNNTGASLIQVCNSFNSTCTPPASSPFATGGVGSGASITWNVSASGDLTTVPSVITSPGTGYWQPIVNQFVLGTASCSTGTITAAANQPAGTLHVHQGGIVGFTQTQLATCSGGGTLTAGTLTATISQGPLFTGGNGASNFITGLGPLSPPAAFATGAIDLVGQLSDTGFSKALGSNGSISYNEDVRLKEFNVDTGGTPGVVGILDTATQNMTVKDGVKSQGSTVWQLICGGGSQQAQNGCNWLNSEFSYPNQFGCPTPNVNGQQSNPSNGTLVGSPVPITWSIATTGILTVTPAWPTGTTVVVQGQPFGIYASAVGTLHGTNVNTGVNNGLGTGTINPPVYVNENPNQAAGAATFFAKLASVPNADSCSTTGGACGYMVFWSGAQLFFGNLVPTRTNRGSIMLATTCFGASNQWTIQDAVVSTAVAGGGTALTVNLGTAAGTSCTEGGGTTCPIYNVGELIKLTNFNNKTFLNGTYVVITGVTNTGTGGTTVSFTATIPSTGTYTTAAETAALATPPVFPVGAEISGQNTANLVDYHCEGYDYCYDIGALSTTSNIHLTNVHGGTNARNSVVHISNEFGEPTQIDLDQILTGGAGGALVPLYDRYLVIDDGWNNALWSANNQNVTNLYSAEYHLDNASWPRIYANCLATHVNDSGSTVQDVQNGDCYFNNNHYKIVGGATIESEIASGALSSSVSVKTPELLDTNGNIIIGLTPTTTAVDYLNVTNGAAGTPGVVTLAALGNDTNININITPKGTGELVLPAGLCTGGSNPSLQFAGNAATTGFAYGGVTTSTNYCAAGAVQVQFKASGVAIANGNVFAMTSGGSAGGSVLAGMSTPSTTAAVIAFGNGTAADTTAQLKAAAYMSVGTKFTSNSGCTESTLVGGATAGSFKVGQNTACTIVITMGNTATAPNGWSCWAYDQTAVPAVAIRQTASNATTASLLMTVATNDVVAFGCVGY